MTLGELFAGLDAGVLVESRAVAVTSLAVDSRRVRPGTLFAAFRGLREDGARYVPQAVAAGASAVLCDRPIDCSPAAPVLVSDARRVFALAAARFYGEPSRRLALLGVTGTNGKTTTASLVAQLATALGAPAGLLGTVEERWPGHAAPSSFTTPEAHELQGLLAQMVAAQVTVAAIEVSSHALAQHRATGCTFAAAAFTNLTRDHLDFHGSLEGYFDSKARLFRELLPAAAPAVVNLDDARGLALAAELADAGRPVLGTSLESARAPRGAALLAADRLAIGLDGLRMTLRFEAARQHLGAPDAPASRFEVQSPLVGAHNAENLLTAIGLLHAGARMPLARLCAATAAAPGAPGRLERVADGAGRHVFVDYAHTDDALTRVLVALRQATASPAATRLICVFGCGGDRDRGKRPLMGRAVGEKATLAVATSDNPRSEDPLQILAEVEAGIAGSGRRRVARDEALRGLEGYVVEPDRRAAIRLALLSARAGDVVLIAGKGHESLQIVGGQRLPFDDRAVAAETLAALGSGTP
jgi:UDP-N-acetylmuramoyl-L-alanyl-D-glutamate--2,6-diaminopimelate ligase